MGRLAASRATPGCPSEPQGPRAPHAAWGQLTYFLARLSFNMGDYAAARRHAVLAWQYAEDVGQPVLCASVRTLQGTIAFYAGQPERGLELLGAAEPYNTPYSRSRIGANAARAYAVLGDRPRAEHALVAMERHLVDLPIQPGSSPYTTAAATAALADDSRGQGSRRAALRVRVAPSTA